ncbi:MAG: hypothetical protein AAB502_00105, partial [Chloroflexota bacterium]
MTNWRVLASIAASALILACLLLFMRALSKPDPSATLSAKLEKTVSDWAANKIPVNERVINLIIGDADAGEDVLSLAPQVQESSLLDKLKGAFGLNSAPRPVNVSNPFTKAFGQDKSAIAWTFDGFSKAQERDVIEELAKNIVKAHDSQAVLNIVAQGE